MNNLFDFLNIDPGDCILEHSIGLNIPNKDECSHLEISFIQDVTHIQDENSLSVIFFLRYREKITKIIQNIRLIKKSYSCKNIYIIYNCNYKRKNTISKSMRLFCINYCLVLSIILKRNPLLFYKYKQKHVVLNLIPDYTINAIGEGFINSLVSFFRKSTQNLISLSKIDTFIIEYS